MRILMLIPSLTGAGAERQLAYLSAELLRRGHTMLVGFVFTGPGEWPEQVPTHRFESKAPWDPRLVLEVLRLLRSFRPDVVQTNLTRMDVAGGIACAVAGAPFVLREPNCRDAYRDVRSLLRAFVGRRARAVVANSSGGARLWRTSLTFVVPNAVPAEEIAATPPIERTRSGAVVVYSGRLSREKNVDVLIRACAAVMAERDLLLYVCGAGPERPRLEALARDLGAQDCIRFTGFVQDAWSYQRGADVAALLSDFEGNPNSVSECFAAGTPMILSDIAPHRELARGDALLVPPRDAPATANAIRWALANRAVVAERAARASRRTRDWSIAAMADAYEDVYGVACRAAAGTAVR